MGKEVKSGKPSRSEKGGEKGWQSTEEEKTGILISGSRVRGFVSPWGLEFKRKETYSKSIWNGIG